MKNFRESKSHFLVTRLCSSISRSRLRVFVFQFSPVLQRKPARRLYVRLRVKVKVLTSQRKIDLHITLDGINAVIK